MNIHKALRFGFFVGLLTMIASTLVLGATANPPASPVIGDWEGKIDTGNGTLRVIIHISQAADGKLTGTLDSPDQQGANGIAIGPVTYKEPDLYFASESLASSYAGIMNRDNSEITGEWKQSGLTLPLVFKRRTK
jgi:hypothetical protein